MSWIVSISALLFGGVTPVDANDLRVNLVTTHTVTGADPVRIDGSDFNNEVVGPLEASLSTIRHGMAVEAWGYADYGLLAAEMSILGALERMQGSTNLHWIGFADRIVIDKPGLTGEQGTVQVALDVTGDTRFDTTVTSGTISGLTVVMQYDLSFAFTSGGEHWDGRWDVDFVQSPGTTDFEGDPFPLGQLVLGPFSFTYGSPITVSMRLTGNQSAYAGSGSSDGTMDIDHLFDAGNTIRWMGMSGLPEDVVVTSDSGTDYLHPVPEPGHGTLLLSALVTLTALCRCRAPESQKPIPNREARVGRAVSERMNRAAVTCLS